MEWIPINAAKLKVILSKEDMQSLLPDGDAGENAETGAFFRAVIERARAETGFDADGGKLYVQMFASADGGCELFVTRKREWLPIPEKPGKNGRFRKKYRFADEALSAERRYLAETDDFEALAALCKRLLESGFRGSSALYFHRGRYVLYLRFPRYTHVFSQADERDDPSGFAFLCDYADVSFADDLRIAVLNERAKVLIASEACQTLQGFFKDSRPDVT